MLAVPAAEASLELWVVTTKVRQGVLLAILQAVQRALVLVEWQAVLSTEADCSGTRLVVLRAEHEAAMLVAWLALFLAPVPAAVLTVASWAVVLGLGLLATELSVVRAKVMVVVSRAKAGEATLAEYSEVRMAAVVEMTEEAVTMVTVEMASVVVMVHMQEATVTALKAVQGSKVVTRKGGAEANVA